MIKEAICRLTQGEDLNSHEVEKVMDEIMSNKATSAQIAGFLIALKIKGEKTEEIAGATKGIIEKAMKIETKSKELIDLCGTGGDGHSTFNISTVSSFVTAGAGVKVAKHGNRSVSSKCGSADLLEALGVNLNLEPEKIAQSIDEIGFGFLFAPLFHPAMKFVLKPRQEIGVRTIFNIIGPLANPLRVRRQLLGVYSPDLLYPVSRTLKLLGTEKALVIHSLDGMDEISTYAPTRGILVTKKGIEQIEINPEEYNFKSGRIEEIKANTVKENVEIFYKILKGEKCPHRDIVLLNSGAAIFISGKARDLKEGIERAQESIDSGKAFRLFSEFLSFSKKND
jgi:anthranilate phosphoribosyltransferase